MARKIRSRAVHYGRNRDIDQNDDKHVRCARCGFICRTDRDTRRPKGSKSGWGIRYDNLRSAESGSLLVEDGGFLTLEGGGNLTLEEGAVTNDGIYDPIVTGGCPQCGTYRYNK